MRRTGYLGRKYRYPLVTPSDEVWAVLLRVFGTVNDLGTSLRFCYVFAYNRASRPVRPTNTVRDGCARFTASGHRLEDAPNAFRLF